MLFGKDIEINGVTFDAYLVADNVSISGYVYRDLHSVSENFNLYGAIGRDASISSKNFNFIKSEDGNIGQIMGNLDYSAEKEISIPEGVVSGEVKFSTIEKLDLKPNYIFLAVTSIIFVLLIWVLLKWLAPKFVKNIDELITNNPAKTIGLGLLAFIAIPVVSVLLLITGFASAVGLLLLAIYVILICLSTSLATIAINNIIAKKVKFNAIILLIVTSLVIWAIKLIPFVGGLVGIVLVLIGLGIIIRNIFEKKGNL